MEPIRICIGTEPCTEVARQVLEFSIRKHARPGAELEFHRLAGTSEAFDSAAARQVTGFSLLRWTIPERFEFAGKAIYLDSDQLCLGDITELWDADRTDPDDRACVWCTTFVAWRGTRFWPRLRLPRRFPETSVMLIDCARAQGRIRSPRRIDELLAANPTTEQYDEIMHLTYLQPPPRRVSHWWNVIDRSGRSSARFLDPRARLVHFTRIATQPWFDPGHSARSLWEHHLVAAIAAGAVEQAEITRACKRFSTAGDRPDGMHPYWKRYAT